jgi:hypothetical protein
VPVPAPGGEKLDLHDRVIVESDEGKLEFEVVGVVEDAESNETYAIVYNEAGDRFIVTDAFGKMLSDEATAQEVLDDFLVFAEESSDEPSVEG